jgi:hypothetical protein
MTDSTHTKAAASTLAFVCVQNAVSPAARRVLHAPREVVA